MHNQDLINEKMKELAMNIDEFTIEEIIEDFDKAHCKITDKSLNSIEVLISKKHKNGINCKQWFGMKDFNKRFKKL